MSEFQFKEIDTEGLATLEVIAGSRNFNRWMYDTIAPHLAGRVLEIGSGIGNISKLFLEAGRSIMLSDLRDNYLGIIQEQFSGHPNLLGFRQLDLVHPQFDAVYTDLMDSFDSAFALNVVEHIQDDVLALRNLAKLVKPGGKVAILVPAYQWLYNQFDAHLHHYRRYTLAGLQQVFDKSGVYKRTHGQYFNLAGIPGWFVSGKLMGNKTIPSGQFKLFDTLVPIFRLADAAIGNRAGLSTIVVAQRV